MLASYGLGLIFAANIFGAGSVYILTTAGGAFGFDLLWVLPLSLILGLVVHEMAARLAVRDVPLMGYIKDVIGRRASIVLAGVIALVMQLWSVANYALTGAILWYLTPLDNLLVAILISGGAGLALVELRLYQRIEAAIAIIALVVFASYGLIFFSVDVPVVALARGFVPIASDHPGYLAMIIALVGTTIYYPNVFIQTSMHHAKPFDTVGEYRRDHTVGLTVAVLMSMAVLVVAAVTSPGGIATVTEPARPLVDAAGPWALVVFLVGAGAASFSSATGTLFAAGFMVPQAYGHRTAFGDRPFRVVIEGLIVLSVVIAVLMLTFTGFTPVEMALTMPAVNGAVGLPLTVLALYGAMARFEDLAWYEHAMFVTVLVAMFGLAVTTVDGLVETIRSFW